MKELGNRVLVFALSLAAAVLLLEWAWDRLRSLLPVLVVIAAIVVIAPAIVRHFRRW